MKNHSYLFQLLFAFLFLLITKRSYAQPSISAVGTGEYVTTYLKNDGTAWVANQANVTIQMSMYAGLSNIVGMDGMQYSTAAWDATGRVYKLRNNATYTTVLVDNLGQPFTGNTLVRGLYQSCLSIRNGEVWYWGIDDVLNQTGGVGIEVPRKLIPPPGSRTIVDIQAGSSTSFGQYTYAWGLASDGTLWQWDRTRTTPLQVTGGWGTNQIKQIALVGHWAKVVVTANNQIWGWGFTGDYVGAQPQWQNPNPVNITNYYTSRGVVFPIKEIVGGSNTLHLIDANDHLFGAGDNVMGEIGNGIGNTFWRTAATPYNWNWSAYGMMQPLTQIPGKFKNFRAGNTVTFYKYVQDLEGNWYSWGRNKSFSLGNGISLPSYTGYPGTTGINYADNPNYYDIVGLRKVTPLTQAWTITPNASRTTNRPPYAYAGADRVFAAGTNTVTLYGAVNQQQPTSTNTITTTNNWIMVSGPNTPVITNSTQQVTTVTGLAAGVYRFRNTCSNSIGLTDFQETTVTILGSNQAPTANAGADATITLPTNTTALNGSATDADGTIASYVWTKIAGPTAGTITNSNAAVTSATGLVQGVYRFELTVTDNAGATDKDTMQVTVNAAPNQAPTANAGADATITLPTNTTSLNGSATDADGTIASYVWTKIAGPTTGTITNANTAVTSATGLVQGVYRFELTVTDNAGATDKDTMQVTVNAASNQAPTVNAGADATITLPTNNTSLNGSATDADGTIASYVWTKIAGPTTGTITNANTAVTSATGLVQGLYRFELRVTDNNGAIARDTMQVTVNPAANQAPTANAGADATITLPTNTTSLNGSATDPDGTIASYLWTKIAGPTAGTITNANAVVTSATGLVQGVYRFELRVTDNSGAIARDTMQVTVNPAANQAPTANAGADATITLPTNTTSLNGSATDADGTIATYLWTKIAGPTAGTITNANAVVTSATGLVQGVYRFELRVTDNSGAIARDTMQVTVNPAANQAPTANAGADATITLPTNTTSLNGSATDADGTIATYLWTKIAGPTAGTITNANAVVTSATGLVQGVYRFELRVTDNSGAIARDTMQVTVNPAANQAPTANAGADATITLPTNITSLNGSATDADGTIASYLWTKIAGPTTGTITNANTAVTSATGLVQGVYRFELTVTDNSGAIARDTMQVTVNPAANQAPTANAGADATITLPTNTTSLNGSATDADGTIASYLWTKIAGPTAGTITNSNAAVTSATGLVQGVYRFELTVTDNSGAIARDTMQVTVNPAANQAPTANAGADATITLPTNTTSLNGSATDADGTIASYLWTKIAGPTTGTITNANIAVTSATGLVQGVYRFELRVTDNSGAIARDTMQVTVNPAANQAPTANAGADATITLPTNTTALNGSATDADGTIASYLWTKIAGPTTGTITNANTAVTSATGLVQGVYRFELRVTDNSGAIARDTMQVTVNPAANQAPTANAGADATITLPTNTTSLNGSATDADGTIASYVWTKIAGPTAGAITNANTAVTSATGLVQGVYRFELRVTDNSGAIARDTMQVTVNASTVNQAPTANAGPDRTIVLPVNTILLNGSGIDNDGNITAFSWTKVSGPLTGTLTNANTPSATANFVEEGVYVYRLTVTDNAGATGTDLVQITVLPVPNTPPLVNAGFNINIYLPENAVQLSAVATDPDGTINAYNWRVINGPSQYIFANANNSQTLFSNLLQGVYELEVKVTDNRGATAADTIMITVGASRTLATVVNNVNVFPNPVQDIMNLEITCSYQRGKVKMLLFDNKGILVLQKVFNVQLNVQIEKVTVSKLLAGMYTIQLVFDDNSQITKQIIKL